MENKLPLQGIEDIKKHAEDIKRNVPKLIGKE